MAVSTSRIGYRDTIARKDELREIFAIPADGNASSECSEFTEPVRASEP